MEPSVAEFLAGQPLCVLTVVLPDGAPESATMHYASRQDPLELYFSTDVNSRKCTALRNGAQANASVVVGFSEQEWVTLQFVGTVSRVPEPELPVVKEILYAKNPNAKKYENDPDTFFLKFVPARWRFSDFTKRPPLTIES